MKSSSDMIAVTGRCILSEYSKGRQLGGSRERIGEKLRLIVDSVQARCGWTLED